MFRVWLELVQRKGWECLFLGALFGLAWFDGGVGWTGLFGIWGLVGNGVVMEKGREGSEVGLLYNHGECQDRYLKTFLLTF